MEISKVVGNITENKENAPVGVKTYLILGNYSNNNFVPFGLNPIEIDDFDFSFVRGCDCRGKCSTELRGGTISLVLSKIPSNNFIAWAVKSNKYFSGEIITKNFEESTVDTLYFQNGACIDAKMFYTKEGSNYFTTQYSIQAEVIKMNGAKDWESRWLGNNKYKDTANIEDIMDMAKDSANNILNKNVNISAYMILGSQQYDVQGFEIGFSQEFDYKGEPQHEVVGGLIKVDLDIIPNKEINLWARNGTPLSGRFMFGSNLVGYEMTINFGNAVCIAYSRRANNEGTDNFSLSLGLAPQQLAFNNGSITFDVKNT